MQEATRQDILQLIAMGTFCTITIGECSPKYPNLGWQQAYVACIYAYQLLILGWRLALGGKDVTMQTREVFPWMLKFGLVSIAPGFSSRTKAFRIAGYSPRIQVRTFSSIFLQNGNSFRPNLQAKIESLDHCTKACLPKVFHKNQPIF